MNIRFWFVIGAVLFGFTNLAESGAAVAMRNKPKGGVKKGQMPQLPPGYVMGPNGVQKISQTGEKESLAQEAVENNQEQDAEVQDTVDLEQIVEVLRSSGKSWELIISLQDKQVIVNEFIKSYLVQGVKIHKPAAFYVNFIDEMAKGSPEMLDLPFARVLQIVAVMEYDFDNGQDRDLLAQKILGDKVYERNKQRLMKTVEPKQ